MRIGIFGGSFDPVHLGHLWIAESAIESLSLDELRWIPAATSPLKPDGPVASDEDRLQMVRLAIGGADKHVIDDREIRRGSISYTVDTLAELRDEAPNVERFLVIGSDSLASFRQWHRPAELLRLATIAVVQRGGDPEIDWSVLDGLADDAQIERMQDAVISMPLIEVSSSDLRSRVKSGKSVRFRIPRAVEAFVHASSLYRA